MKYNKITSRILAMILSAGVLITSAPQAVLCVSAEELKCAEMGYDFSFDSFDTETADESDNEKANDELKTDSEETQEDNSGTDNDTGNVVDSETDNDTVSGGETDDDLADDSDSDANEEVDIDANEETDIDANEEADIDANEETDIDADTEEEPGQEIITDDNDAEKVTAEKTLFFEKKTDGYIVTVYAAEGVFPEGAEVSIKKLEEQRGLELEDSILLENELGYYVEKVTVFDITFSFEGQEIQPVDGSVAVVISLADEIEEPASKEESEIKVYHIDDATDDLEEKKIVEAEDVLPEEVLAEIEEKTSGDKGDEIAFEADAFSEYALAVITECNEEEADFGYYMSEIEENYDYTYHDAEAVIASGFGVMTFNDASIPAQYVTQNLPGLRDQNPYGTCWAHSAMALGEIYMMNNSGDSTARDYSELQLSYFTYNNVEDPLGGTAGDHNNYTGARSGLLDYGGNLVYAGRQLASWQGATSEEKAPYNSTYQAMALGSGLDASLAYDDEVHLTNFYQIEVSNTSNFDDAKKLIMENGALGVSIYAYGSEYAAKAAHVFSSTNNAFYMNTPKGASGGRGTNHAVTIVGWDDGFSASNFLTDPGADGAWLVRNSWTTSSDGNVSDNMGYYGYFWISYYDANISKGMSYTFEDADNYDNNYQYDGNLVSGYLNYNTCANIFSAHACEGGEMLKAASFNTLSQNASFTIDVYTDLTDLNNPTSGTLATSESGNIKYSGYYTVPFDTWVPLSEGEVFSIVVTIEDTEGAGSIGIENDDVDAGKGISLTADAEIGQSFVKGSTKWIDASKQLGKNIRIKAFTSNCIPVTQISLSGNIAGTTVKLAENKTYTPTWEVLPANATNKTIEWSSSNVSVAAVDPLTGTVTAVSPGTSVMTCIAQGGRVTVSYTVKIIANSYSITYVLNGGTNSSKNPTVYTKKTNNIVFYNPTKTGYTFVGWYTSSSYKKQVTIISKGSTGDRTLYAKWKANKYTVRYDANGGSGSMIDSTCTYNKSFTLRKNRFTRKGYRFVGWATSKKGNVVFGNKQWVETNLKSKAGAVKTLYAKWQAINYSVTYKNVDGASIGSNPTTYTVKKGVKLQKASKPGYTFKGWYTDSKLTKRVTAISKGSTGNKKFYAKWVANKYYIEFDAGGGTGAVPETMRGTYSPSVILPYSYLSKPGYSFGGWMDDKGNVYSYGSGVAPFAVSTKGNKITLHAYWIAE